MGSDHIKKLERLIDSKLQADKLEEFNKTRPIFDIVKLFILKKKLILYGGLAINDLLPTKDQFYDKYTIPDYDCFSPNAKKDAIDLAKILNRNKYPYIEVKPAQHEGTYKVYVDFLGVADITQIDYRFYNALVPQCVKSKDKLLFIPPEFIKYGLYLEMARPDGSLYRWEKIYGRSILFLKEYPNNKTVEDKRMKLDNDDLEKRMINILKNNKFPVIGSFGVDILTEKKHSYINEIWSRFQILSENPNKDMLEIIELLNLNTDKYKLNYFNIDYLGVLSNTLCLKIYDKEDNKEINFLSITETDHYCYSYIKKNRFTVGTGFTIITFLFAYLLEYKIINNSSLYYDTEYLIGLLGKWMEKKEINNLFITTCYGTEQTLISTKKDKWINKNNNQFKGWRPQFTYKNYNKINDNNKRFKNWRPGFTI